MVFIVKIVVKSLTEDITIVMYVEKNYRGQKKKIHLKAKSVKTKQAVNHKADGLPCSKGVLGLEINEVIRGITTPRL